MCWGCGGVLSDLLCERVLCSVLCVSVFGEAHVR